MCPRCILTERFSVPDFMCVCKTVFVTPRSPCDLSLSDADAFVLKAEADSRGWCNILKAQDKMWGKQKSLTDYSL